MERVFWRNDKTHAAGEEMTFSALIASANPSPCCGDAVMQRRAATYADDSNESIVTAVILPSRADRRLLMSSLEQCRPQAALRSPFTMKTTHLRLAAT